VFEQSPQGDYKTAALPTELRQQQENHESYHTKGYSAGLGVRQEYFLSSKES
jgi:hypothetical protein